MNYTETLNYIWSIKKFTDKTDLKTMKVMMQELGNPQQTLKVIHVAGTNGKGSVCNYIASSLVAAGYRTGLYLSPFLEIFNERMRVNGNLISDDDIVRLSAKVKPAAERAERECGRFPKQFEFVTAIAFLYFAEQNCDYVVLETGMGGLLDATNIIEKPVMSIITSVGLDHTHILGNTLEEIAEKKSGIIKPGCPVLCDPFMDERALQVIKEQAKQKGAPFQPIDPKELRICSADLEGISFTFLHEKYRIHMLGEHQIRNCGLAIASLLLLGIPLKARQEGVSAVCFPGRMEKILPNVLVDGAHNEMGIRALMSALAFHNIQKPVFMISIGKEKKYEQMLSVLFDKAGKNAEFYFTAYDKMAAVDPEELCRFAANQGMKSGIIPTVRQAAETLMKPENAGTFYVLCGSLYFVGNVKNEIKARQLHKKTEN